MCDKLGAGALPFCVHDNDIWFLFHETFSGKKVGTLIDFGGATEEGEEAKETAAREFAEETMGCYFYVDEYKGMSSTKELIVKSTNDMLPLLTDAPIVPVPTYKYQFYIPRIPYHNVTQLNDVINRAFAESDDVSTQKDDVIIRHRRRRFVWVRGSDVLDGSTELPLFTRVQLELDELKKVIRQLYKDNLNK